MRLGVKMCGNCNPDIESMKCAKKIAERLGMELVRYDEGDLTLTMSACVSSCVYEDYPSPVQIQGLHVNGSACASQDELVERAVAVYEKLLKRSFKMTVLERMECAGVVPVVVLENAADAVPTANALAAGGLDVMEITFRTDAAADSIKAVAENCPDTLVGAGTVITLDQAKKAVECGAKFIVSPGFSEKVVAWCLENDIPVTPGCVTPTEITAAYDMGLRVVKFFPAGVYGGLNAMKNLNAPFNQVKFIPTGGVNAANLGEYAAAPFIHAVGGSWVCNKKDIAEHKFDKITALAKEAHEIALGFEIAHIGINTDNEDAAMDVAKCFEKAFGFAVKPGNSSNFAGPAIEVMKSQYLGTNGHIAVRTNSINAAVAELAKRGFEPDWETAKKKGDKVTAVYLKGEVGGFAVHLLQK